MNTRLDTDPELLDLVRTTDPMRDPRVQANAGLDTESALRLLAPELDRVTARDGARFTSEVHEWLSTSPPYNNRLIRIWNGKVQWEQAFVNGQLDLYDPRTNTVYLAPGVAPGQVSDTPDSTSALSEVQYLLRQPNVTINPNVMLDGKPAIELTFVGGRFS